MEEVAAPPWFEDGLRFKCTGCGKCCTGSPGYVFLSQADIERLAAHFSMKEEDFMRQKVRYVDQQYALLDRPGSGDCIGETQCARNEAGSTHTRANEVFERLFCRDLNFGAVFVF